VKNLSAINRLTEAWRAGLMHAENIAQALDEQPHRAVVLPNRHIAGAPSTITLACILQRTRRYPAIVIGCGKLIDLHRRTLAEGLPNASIAVVDWCHPTPAEPAEITLLCESQLPRTAATLAGYHPEAIAYFGAIDRSLGERRQRAFRSLLDAAPDPMIVLEEWTHPAILAVAVARLTGSDEHAAGLAVTRWLDQHTTPAAQQRCASTDALLAVRDLCSQTLRAAA
jgi:hypothetical protein